MLRNLASIDGFLCAVSVKYAGYDVSEGRLLSITLLPLDENLCPHTGMNPITVDIRKQWSYFSKKIRENTKDVENSANVLKKWYKNLKTKKRICLVGYDLFTPIELLREWLTVNEYLKIFSPVYRDIQQIQIFLKDAHAFGGGTGTKIEAINDIASLKVERGIKYSTRWHPEQECLFVSEVLRHYLHLMG